MTPFTEALIYLTVAGFAATYVWRLVAAIAVARIDPESEILIWVRCVATALVAALVMRIVIEPPGALAETTLASRLIAIGLGLAAYRLANRNVEAGVATAVTTIAVSAIAL